jgi:hypothetical protein
MWARRRRPRRPVARENPPSDPSSNSTRWLSECARIFIAVHRNSCAAWEFKDGFSCDEMTGHSEYRNAGENKQRYRSSNPSI